MLRFEYVYKQMEYFCFHCTTLKNILNPTLEVLHVEGKIKSPTLLKIIKNIDIARKDYTEPSA